MKVSFSTAVSVSIFHSALVVAAPSKFSPKRNAVAILAWISLEFIIVMDQVTEFTLGVSPNLAISSTGNNDEKDAFSSFYIPHMADISGATGTSTCVIAVVNRDLS
jgi:hypothetical protein